MVHSHKQINQMTSCYFQAILVGEFCPSQENVAMCEADLPEFWNLIAALLWPGYWDPTVSLKISNNSVDDQCCQFVFQSGRMDVCSLL